MITYKVSNDTSSPRMDGNSKKTQVLLVSGMALHPGQTMVSSTLTSDILSFMKDGLVTVLEVDGPSNTPISFSDIEGSVATYNEPLTIYTADGPETRLVVRYKLDEEVEDEAPFDVEEVEPEVVPVEDEAPFDVEEVEPVDVGEDGDGEEEEEENLSKNFSVSDAKELIGEYEDKDDLNAFIEGDNRKTVKSAAKARISELN